MFSLCSPKGFAYGIATQIGWPVKELFTAGVLLAALALKRLFLDVMKSRSWAKIIANVILVYGLFLAALALLNLFDSLGYLLRGVVFQYGDMPISLLKTSRAFFLFLIRYWMYKKLQSFSAFG
ncbi:hypothetical protein [Desulfovibrio sp. TomC]|uniref:hypothetical protein n=1 Tax=Desulfovibrio sp. TomC TaxID=1562888 RepID=UPI0005738217|nr:hypothetical protein [Desulfovibrio sp. TomC]KHK02603.1 hypothetical protein NY78_1960 [Desulfovibrio sp. TomC]